MTKACENCGRPLTEDEQRFGVRRCPSCAEAREAPVVASARHLEPATFWSRVGAYVLDYVIGQIGVVAPAFGLAFLAAILSYFPTGDTISTAEEDRAYVVGFVVLIVVYMALAIAYFWIGNALGATIGKRLVGIRVVDLESGQPIGLRRGFWRLLVWVIGSVPLYLGWLWAAWDADRQAWHDKAARSVVVRAWTAPEVERPAFPWYKTPLFRLGLVVTVLVVGLTAAGSAIVLLRDRAFEGSPAEASGFGLEIGDCIAYGEDGFGADIVDCASVHDAIVLDRFEVIDPSYPGEDELFDQAIQACPPLADIYIYPFEDEWALGIKEIVCIDELD